MNRRSSISRKRLGIVLSSLFAIAVVMGAGPGLYLVNPNPSDPEANVTWQGVPILYAWVVLWFLVQALVVLLAYFGVWNASPHDASREAESRGGGQREADR